MLSTALVAARHTGAPSSAASSVLEPPQTSVTLQQPSQPPPSLHRVRHASPSRAIRLMTDGTARAYADAFARQVRFAQPQQQAVPDEEVAARANARFGAAADEVAPGGTAVRSAASLAAPKAASRRAGWRDEGNDDARASSGARGVLTGGAEVSWRQHDARVATAGTSAASKVSLNMSPSPAELSSTLRHAAAEGSAQVSSTSSQGEEPDKCVPPDPRGYLFPLLSNQFNNQLIGLAENIRLAQRLGRILVLTGFVEAILNASSTSTSLASDGLDFYHNSVRHRLRPAGMVAERPGPLPRKTSVLGWGHPRGPSRLHSIAIMAPLALRSGQSAKSFSCRRSCHLLTACSSMLCTRFGPA